MTYLTDEQLRTILGALHLLHRYLSWGSTETDIRHVSATIATIQAEIDRRQVALVDDPSRRDAVRKPRESRVPMAERIRRLERQVVPVVHTSKPDAECTVCGAMYYSGEGHPDSPICGKCVDAAILHRKGLRSQERNEVRSLPDDYEACGDCGFDHAYEQAEARREHESKGIEWYDSNLLNRKGLR